MQHDPPAAAAAATTTTAGSREDRRPALAAYLSGHGFGHFTRSAAVLEPLADRFAIHLRTAAQALSLARRVPWAASVTEVDVGPGVVQRGPLAVDVVATLAALQQHGDRLPALVAAEAAWLRAARVRAVFADVPPLGFAAAAAAQLPSVGMSNFTWSWIYDGYAHHDSRFAEEAARLREAEAQATFFLALEGGGGFEHFAAVRECAPIIRRPQPIYASPEGRTLLRRRLGIDRDETRPVVLLSFGGFGAELALRDAATHNTALRLLVVSGPADLHLPHARSVEPHEAREAQQLGGDGGPEGDAPLTHPDLVFAADCVIGKPGYGTVTECLHRPTAFVHVPRGEFREQPALVEFLRAHLPSAPLPLEEFLAGRWLPAVEIALASRPSESPVRGDGITAAGALLAEVAEGRLSPAG